MDAAAQNGLRDSRGALRVRVSLARVACRPYPLWHVACQCEARTCGQLFAGLTKGGGADTFSVRASRPDGSGDLPDADRCFVVE